MFSCFSLLPRSPRVKSLISGVILGLTVTTAGISHPAHADEFSLVPLSDSIYRQLDTLTPRSNAQAPRQALTRYEIALQTARIITSASHGNQPLYSRADWRALRELSQSLRPELTRLGIDVPATLALCDKNLSSSNAPEKKRPADAVNPDFLGTTLPSTTQTSFATAISANTRSSSLVRKDFSDADLQQSSLNLPISQRLRAEAALLALQRTNNDPFETSKLQVGKSSEALGQSTSLAFDFNSWLSVRALASNRDLKGSSNATSILEAPLFAGASEARGTGGGVDVSVGSLKLSTEVERLRTDAGLAGTRVGGGIGLSAWQNRLSLSAHLSRLVPEDREALSATAAELNLGLDVTRSLSLGLQYQNLFTPESSGSTSTSTSRVSGGLSVSF